MKMQKWRELLRCPKELPVETALCLIFFMIAVVDETSGHWDDVRGERLSAVNGDILMLFVPLFSLTFYLHRVNRWAYVISALLFIPLMMTDLKPFLWSASFGLTYALAAILLVIGIRKLANRPFAAHLLHVVTQGFFGVLVAGLLTIATVAIVSSFLYIFGIDDPEHLYEYIYYFVWLVVAPLACAFFVSRDEYAEPDLPKVIRLILNAILSPAIIIYTVILYAYFIKIAVTWDLPKGGVAYMVMAFIAVSLAGYLAQYLLPKRYYDRFYRHFTWIAIPPLVMFWIGSIYRIRLYSFTEGRFYLLVAGVLMTLFVLMLLWERSRKFQWMALISGVMIIIFTYIPGISAKSIGLRSQTARMEKMIEQLHLRDGRTGKLTNVFDRQRITSDSLLSARYAEADDVVRYVRHEMGEDRFVERYGAWEFDPYVFRYTKDTTDQYTRLERKQPVDLGPYGLLLDAERYRVRYSDSTVILQDEKWRKEVLREPLKKADRLDAPELFVYSNDSLLVAFTAVWADSTCQVRRIADYNFQVFARKSQERSVE